MDRVAKQAVIDELKGKLSKSMVAIVCDFRGIKVSEVDTVRRALRKEKVEYKVVKNTLAALAMDGTPMRKALEPHLVGPSAIVWADEDPAAPSKVLNKLTKDIAALKIRAGYLEGRALNAQQVQDLASLPGKPEQRAMFLGLLNAPATAFVRVLSGVSSEFVRVLEARRRQLAEAGGSEA